MWVRRQVIAGLVLLFLAGADAVCLAAETVKMRIVVVNPSAKKKQTKTIKNYLPKEVRASDIEDSAGLQADYDDEQEMFYVFKNDVELAPGEDLPW